ncbi:MAG: 30S ribosomal protein S17 [Patescibacteria group bacterium]
MVQTLKGKIVSNKMLRTVVVEVSSLKKHPVYGKYFTISKRYKAHTDEKIDEGKIVLIEPTKPVSKDKKWKVTKVL